MEIVKRNQIGFQVLQAALRNLLQASVGLAHHHQAVTAPFLGAVVNQSVDSSPLQILVVSELEAPDKGHQCQGDTGPWPSPGASAKADHAKNAHSRAQIPAVRPKCRALI
jgi:hypothetical protein